ncbi:MAG: MFS transporter [Myxococcota bacterium]
MHRAWILVGLVFLTQFVGNATGFYAFAVILPPAAEEFAVSRARINMVPFALSVSGMVMAPLIGHAVNRVSIRLLMTLGALFMGLTFLAMSRAESVWQLQLGYALGISFASNTLMGVAATTLLVRWFDEKRALALGVAGVGISLAGFVMTPITAGWVEAYGWRGTFQIFALGAFLLAPLVAWLTVGDPRDRGLRPYGRSETPASPDSVASSAPAVEPLSTREALGVPALWWIAVATGISLLAVSGVITHAVSLGTDAGYDPVASAYLLSAAAGAAALGKLLFGWLAERLGEREAFALATVLHTLGLLGMAESRDSYPLLLTTYALFGLGMGGITPLMAALLARAFGPVHFGPVMGLAGPILIVFQSMGPPLLGYVYDTWGDYGPGLWGFALIQVVPLYAMWRLRYPVSATEGGGGDGGSR